MLLSDLLEGLNKRGCIISLYNHNEKDPDKKTILNGTKDIEISGICSDHNRIKKGDIFIAIKGLRHDGHLYIDNAVRQGAAAVLVSEDYVKNTGFDLGEIPVLISENTREACAYLFAAYYGYPQEKMKMIGITGTNGKTTVANLLFHILRWDNVPCGIIGTLGCYTNEGAIDIRSSNPEANMTTPDPEELYAILNEMYCRGVSVVIMETTSHALALDKVAPINFDIGVFTNLSEDHFDLHGNIENYFAAKAKMFEKCRRAVINCDDRYGRALADKLSGRMETNLCSMGLYRADSVAEDVRYSGDKGIEYKLTSAGFRLRIRCGLFGEFNVMNSMQAAIVSHLLGIGARDVQDAFAHFGGVNGRLEKLKLDGRCDFSVYIDYAHTPDALENLLRTVRSFSKNDRRLVLLFGCGGDRDKQKRPIMGKIATEMADFVVITSDNCRGEKRGDIINDILSGIRNEGCYTVIEDRKKAIEYVIKTAASGDIIILAGKGHERYDIGEGEKIAFSEKDLVNEFIKKYW